MAQFYFVIKTHILHLLLLCEIYKKKTKTKKKNNKKIFQPTFALHWDLSILWFIVYVTSVLDAPHKMALSHLKEKEKKRRKDNFPLRATVENKNYKT